MTYNNRARNAVNLKQGHLVTFIKNARQIGVNLVDAAL